MKQEYYFAEPIYKQPLFSLNYHHYLSSSLPSFGRQLSSAMLEIAYPYILSKI
jgi:hypothetical protein